MYYVCEKVNNLFGVKDTTDNVVEYYNKSQLYKIVNEYKLEIKGVAKDGNIYIYSPSNFKDVIDDFIEIMRMSGGGSSVQKNYEEGTAAIRYWGDWKVPSDIDEDEIEDYDWEELTPEWMSKLGEIRRKLQSKYTDIIIYIQTNEKNWIDIEIRRK